MKLEPPNHIALLGVADAGLARRLISELLRPGQLRQFPLAESFAQLRARLARISPVVILLDEAILDGLAVDAAVRQLSKSAPVIVLAGADREAALAPLVALGDVDLVARIGDFLPLVAGLIERHLRRAEHTGITPVALWADLPSNFSEILRHEINNPLTGILGNAEMLLAHRDRLPAAAAQRLETIVDLAVRLRETIRQLSLGREAERQLRAS